MSFLSVALVFLVAAIIAVPVAKRLGLSSVLGYLLAGVAIGPYGLAVIVDTSGTLHFAEIGVVLLLFIIGLEVQPRRLWVMRSAVFGLGSAQVLLTALLLALGMLILGLDLAPAALLGFALALSSTAFVLQLLGEQKKLNHPHGRAAFGILLFQDLAVIPVIAAVNLSGQDTQRGFSFATDIAPLLAMLAALAVARFALRHVLRYVAATGVHELFTATALAIVVGAALAMDGAGLSMGLGAFAAGMLVADSEYRHQLESDVQPFKGLLLGLFFMAVGMSVDISALGREPGLIFSATAALVLLKALALFPLSRKFGLDPGEALRNAVVLSQGGEFAFVLLSVSLAAGILPAPTAAIAVLVVTLSMASTPLLVRALDLTLERHGEQNRRAHDKIPDPQRPVIVAGFGRFGQIVARVLGMRGIPFTALDSNPWQVDFVRRYGNEIYYGDPGRMELLHTSHIENARALVIAVNDAESALRIAALVRENFPNVTLLARALDRYHEIQLRELGVEYVIRESLLSSLDLSRELLRVLGDNGEQAQASIEMFQEHDQRLLQHQAAIYHDDEAMRQSVKDAARELQQLFAEDHGDSTD